MNEEVKISVYMPKELKKEFHRRCISEEKTISTKVNELVTEYLNKVDIESDFFK